MKLSPKTYSNILFASEFESVFPLEICQKYGIQPTQEGNFVAIYTPNMEFYTSFEIKDSYIEETDHVYRLNNKKVCITLYKNGLMANITIL